VQSGKQRRRCDAKSNFRSSKKRRLASALRHIENVTRLKPDVLSFPLQNFPEIHNDLLLLTCRIFSDDYSLILPGSGN